MSEDEPSPDTDETALPDELNASEEPGDPRSARRQSVGSAMQQAWEQTLEDMEAIAADRRDDGWEVLTVTAAHTDTVSRDMGDHDDFGLFLVVPDNHAEAFAEMYDSDEFTEFLVYGAEIEQLMNVVIELIDPDDERSILLACQYDLALMRGGMAQNAMEEGVLYTHVKTIDGTVIGTFEHEEYEPLLPQVEQ